MHTDPLVRDTSRFYTPGTPDPARWMLERYDVGTYRVTEQIEYLDRDGYSYVFPLDVNTNNTDFASIPWFLTWLVPRDGRHTPAAIMHDSFIGGHRDVDYSTTRPDGVGDEHADYLFREAMEHAQVGLVRRWMMWAGVSIRTMSLSDDRKKDNGDPKLNPVKIGLVGVVVVAWAVVSALIELDVPDFQRPGWHVPWFGNRPWYAEIFHSLVVTATASAAFAMVIGLILRKRRAPFVGAIAGAIVGFFGLPMVASAVGWSGYVLLDGAISKLKEGHFAKPLMLPIEPDPPPVIDTSRLR